MILNIDKMTETQKDTIIKYLNNNDEHDSFSCCKIKRHTGNGLNTFDVEVSDINTTYDKNCIGCIFKNGRNCSDLVITTWLLSEYKEPEKPIVLTDKEKLFIKYVIQFFGIDVWLIHSKPYLTNENKDLYIFDSNPCLGNDGINWDIKNYWCKNTADILEFVTPDKPYKIADLMQYLDK